MKASELLIQKMKEFEGVRLTSYKDSVGIWTIGIGHTKGVRPNQTITMAQCETLLKGDLLPCEQFVNSIKEIDTQGKFDALVDFSFNLGIGALKDSTLLKRIRKHEDESLIKNEFLKWVHAGGKVENGLVKRRNWEAMRYSQKG